MHVIDSRFVGEGDCFYALEGERVNGHCFLEEVASRGGAQAVVSLSYLGPDFGLELTRVPNVEWELKRRAKTLAKPLTIAVTGSVGKTTTKEFIAHILEGKYSVAKSPGNANSQVGLPCAILNMPMADIWVLEMGMSRKGELLQLVDMAPPDIAVITKISLQHAEYFEDIHGIAKAKAELFTHPRTKVGILSKQAAEFCEIMDTGTCRKVICPDVDPIFTAHHMNEDYALAHTVAIAMSMTDDEILKRAKTLTPFKHRFETFEKDGVIYIDDAYNAAPEAVLCALDNLPEANGRKIAVLGEMKELGKYAADCHLAVGEKAAKVLDYALLLGENCRLIEKCFKQKGKPVEWFANKADLKAFLEKVVAKGDVVLVKGANSDRLWEVCSQR